MTRKRTISSDNGIRKMSYKQPKSFERSIISHKILLDMLFCNVQSSHTSHQIYSIYLLIQYKFVINNYHLQYYLLRLLLRYNLIRYLHLQHYLRAKER